MIGYILRSSDLCETREHYVSRITVFRYSVYIKVLNNMYNNLLI